MKKTNVYHGKFKLRHVQKIFRVMKITSFLLLIAFIQVSAATTYSQSTKLNLNYENVKLSDLLDKIEKASDYRFFFNSQSTDLSKTVSVNSKDSDIKEVLDKVLGSNLTYEMVNNNIIVIKSTNFGTEELSGSQQQKIIIGKVTDSSGSPLPGVSVAVKGKTIGTITDANGNYNLSNVPSDATLQFSFVGMKTQEVKVTGKTSINIPMEEETIGLDEVVAIGYGTQKKTNLTGSVVSVNSKELAQRPVSNITQALQGKLAGVSISQNTGQPGAEGLNINIRGLNSYGTSSTPIVLVDGIEGNISDLDPENIESVSVLKDASSAAIYGSRAANGVILITTKRGKIGEFSLTYHTNLAIQTFTRIPDLVNDPVEYMEMYNIASHNSNSSVSYPESAIEQYKSGELKGFNWDNACYKKPLVQKHNLTMTGGTQKLKYNFGIGYYDQDGVVIGYNYKKYNVSFNFDSEINKYISIGGNINFLQDEVKGTYNSTTDMMISISTQAPTYAPKLSDGSYVAKAYPYETCGNKNPIALSEVGGSWTKKYNVISQAFIKVKPIKDLIWETNGSIKYDHSYTKTSKPAIQEYYYSTGNYAQYMDGSVTSLTVAQPFDTQYSLFSTLTYSKTIKLNHHLNVLAGYNQQNYRYNYLYGYRKSFPNNDLTELDAGGADNQVTSGTAYEWALRSYFGRLSYDYKGKYLVELNIRRDGSSRFSEGNKYGNFPSVSAGWRLSEEGFAKQISWLSNLKVRASWGKLGNQEIGNYPYQDLISLGSGYSYDNSSTSVSAYVSSLSNKNITWETTKVGDIGFDSDIKNGLFSLTFDYFNKTTSGILRTSQVMATVGLAGPTANQGEMKNTGYEFILGHKNKIGELKYDLSFNLSHYKNEVTKFGKQEISSPTIVTEGIPYNSWYMYEFDGIYQSTEDIDASPTNNLYTPKAGDIKLKDTNGDGVVNTSDRVVVKGRYPSFSYGFNLSLEWKNFDFSTFIQGVEGIKRYVTGWGGIRPFYQGCRPSTEWRNAWTEDNHSNSMPAIYITDASNNNGYTSTYYLQDASYLRFKNIQLGYNLPKVIVGKIGLTSARVYFSGDNLITITHYEGADPERSLSSTNYAQYPQVATYSLGLMVKF